MGSGCGERVIPQGRILCVLHHTEKPFFTRRSPHTMSVSNRRGDTMKQPSSLWQAAGFALTTFGGTLLHFWYEWSDGNILTAPFSGVNESTWEHMKLLFWPLVLFAFLQRHFFREKENYWCIKLAGILLGLTLIPVLFYTYNGIFGKSSHWINIAIFYISAALVFLFERRAFQTNRLPCRYPLLALGAICMIGALFVVFTFMPPQIPLFRDPLTGTYGLPGA